MCTYGILLVTNKEQLYGGTHDSYKLYHRIYRMQEKFTSITT